MGGKEGRFPYVLARREIFAVSLIRQLHMYANKKRVENQSIREARGTDHVQNEMQPLFAP